MDVDQKKFKIEKIEKYSQNWKETKEELENAYSIGFVSLVNVVLGGIGCYEILNLPANSNTDAIDAILISMLVSGSVFTFESIRSIVKGLKNKSYLEKRIDVLNSQINDNKKENEQSRGGR